MHRALMLAIAAFVIVVDQYTKYEAIVHLAPRPEVYGHPYPLYVPVIENFFHLTYAENRGAAFSFMHEHPWVILLIASVMIIGIIIWAFRLPTRNYWVQSAFGLIIGGAVGNLIDRGRLGFVVDFLDVFIIRNGQRHTWPTFNVADIAIVVGIGLFMYLTAFTTLLDSPKKPAPASNDATDTPQETDTPES